MDTNVMNWTYLMDHKCLITESSIVQYKNIELIWGHKEVGLSVKWVNDAHTSIRGGLSLTIRRFLGSEPNFSIFFCIFSYLACKIDEKEKHPRELKIFLFLIFILFINYVILNIQLNVMTWTN